MSEKDDYSIPVFASEDGDSELLLDPLVLNEWARRGVVISWDRWWFEDDPLGNGDGE